MAGLKCEHCGHSIRYHGESNGIELIMFCESAWQNIIESVFDPNDVKMHTEYPVPIPYQYTADTIYDDFNGTYSKIWRCPNCGALHIFDMKDITRVTAVFVPCEDHTESLKGTKSLFILYDDIAWDKLTELSIPTAEIEQYYPPTYYALLDERSLALYEDKGLSKLIGWYKKQALTQEE